MQEKVKSMDYILKPSFIVFMIGVIIVIATFLKFTTTTTINYTSLIIGVMIAYLGKFMWNQEIKKGLLDIKNETKLEEKSLSHPRTSLERKIALDKFKREDIKQTKYKLKFLSIGVILFFIVIAFLMYNYAI